jgi:polyketide biosynthesis enoyl-CoA hydratase PksH
MNNSYETIRLRIEDEICFIQIHRPEANNAINDCLIEELSGVLRTCETSAKIVVFEGLADSFCVGADFKEIHRNVVDGCWGQEQDPEPLYDLWYRLASGPYVTIAHVRGRTNAGGIGFVAACDIVLCEERATFSLSELLFGLMPACVMPFLIRRMGFAKANYLTLTTQPITARQALEWGLVDACEENSENLLRKLLLRLRHLSKNGIMRYKRYASSLDNSLLLCKARALEANMEVFSDVENLKKIAHFMQTGSYL